MIFGIADIYAFNIPTINMFFDIAYLYLDCYVGLVISAIAFKQCNCFQFMLSIMLKLVLF